ncbi:type III secretion inner rod protein HrpB2 [Paraburkholderia terricola]|uniref:type III secretion protein HrpB2 n=1 Tax=Paraburkholderia terricola TaxID=169427 RepID=UPI002855EA60|nr:type III secretion protein HrpB2 [Paraburkholderia terricola]MDR6448571.1 type III secretion inner rod protein HrpB2 [Paraburkholderia terricola]
MTLPVTSKQFEAALQAATSMPATQPGADPGLQQAGERFASMMQNPRMAAPVHGDDMNTNVIAKMAVTQDAELQQSVNDVVALSSQAGNMSLPEMTAAAMKTTLELATTQLDMQAKMGVVNSSKSSIETLMKNQ